MLPVFGWSRTTPGLVHAFGFSGHGFQLAPGVGAVVADLIAEGRTETGIEAFSIARFAGEWDAGRKALAGIRSGPGRPISAARNAKAGGEGRHPDLAGPPAALPDPGNS